jgi:hypothetical protein
MEKFKARVIVNISHLCPWLLFVDKARSLPLKKVNHSGIAEIN